MDAAEHTAPDEHAAAADVIVTVAAHEAVAASDETGDEAGDEASETSPPSDEAEEGAVEASATDSAAETALPEAEAEPTAHPMEIEHLLTSAHTLLSETMQNISAMLGNLGHMITSLRPGSHATDESAAEEAPTA